MPKTAADNWGENVEAALREMIPSFSVIPIRQAKRIADWRSKGYI